MIIQKYNSDTVYEIFEIQGDGEEYKIGEIENYTFYDLDKKGKRVKQGYNFSNEDYFWKQFKKIKIKKTLRPIGRFTPIVWGTYWSVSVLLTIGLVVGADTDIAIQIFWLVTSVIHLGITIMFRRKKIVTYWMIATIIFFIVPAILIHNGELL